MKPLNPCPYSGASCERRCVLTCASMVDTGGEKQGPPTWGLVNALVAQRDQLMIFVVVSAVLNIILLCWAAS